MHFAITSPVGAVQPPVALSSRERERDVTCTHRIKKFRLPEWYVLAWMIERALNAGA
jgi:hypothetical protein